MDNSSFTSKSNLTSLNTSQNQQQINSQLVSISVNAHFDTYNSKTKKSCSDSSKHSRPESSSSRVSLPSFCIIPKGLMHHIMEVAIIKEINNRCKLIKIYGRYMVKQKMKKMVFALCKYNSTI